MAKRRTSGIQRRSRASEEAMGRRLGASTSRGLDWRVLVIGGILVLGVVILVLVLLFGGGTNTSTAIGQRQADAGRTHIPEGTQGTGYTSVPATSGPHWSSVDSPGPWGVYKDAQRQERMLHNMEHGGIVIWYQAAALSSDQLASLTTFVQQQITTDQYKVILTPWGGADFGHPIAVTAWDWLLYLDSADLDKIRSFIDAHYENSPEPAGGPPKPGT
jgi:hypothetical protein